LAQRARRVKLLVKKRISMQNTVNLYHLLNLQPSISDRGDVAFGWITSFPIFLTFSRLFNIRCH
jgi:hypothetical protein